MDEDIDGAKAIAARPIAPANPGLSALATAKDKGMDGAKSHDAIKTPPQSVTHERNAELGKIGSQLALYNWFVKNEMLWILPQNVEQPSSREKIMRLVAHEYFQQVKIMEWLPIYTEWCRYVSYKPRQMNGNSFIPPRLSQHEESLMNKHHDLAYSKLRQAYENVKDHPGFIKSLFKKYQYQVEQKSSKRFNIEGNVGAYDPNAIKNVEEEPQTDKELIQKLQNNIAQMAIDREGKENALMAQIAAMQAEMREMRTGAVRKNLFDNDAADASPRLPAPVLATGTVKNSNREGRPNLRQRAIN